MEKIEYALESFKNIQDLIKFIDQKSGAVLVIAGLIFTGYVEFIKDLKLVESNPYSLIEIVTFVSSLLTLITLIVVIYISIFKVLKPRLAVNYKEDEASLFYFEHLEKMGKTEIINNYESLDDSKKLTYIIEQQFEVSKILKQKTKFLSISFNWLFASVLFLIIFIICSIQL